MLKTLRFFTLENRFFPVFIRKQSFLTNSYSCTEAWNSRYSSPIINKINLNDFYNILDQNYTSKGVISAVDVDIFANSIKDSNYLDELRDLLYKLRLSAETGKTLDSTHHAAIRGYIEHGNVHELVSILKDPLTYGIFLDAYTANILLDKLIASQDFDHAAVVGSLVMLQEDFSNDLTCSLSQYACYKYISNYVPPPKIESENSTKKPEEIKIRIKFLRNPYYDDHFDIQDNLLLAGKTLAWMSEIKPDPLNYNLQIIGWLYYKKYDKLVELCENISKKKFPIFKEVLELIEKEGQREGAEDILVTAVKKSLTILSKLTLADKSLEDSLKISIENAINKVQTEDIAAQNQLYQSWLNIRQQKLDEQVQRLDRAKRIQFIEEKQMQMKDEEQKLWFFENEDQIDLEIEAKEKLERKSTTTTKAALTKSDEEYIPPEILPKRR